VNANGELKREEDEMDLDSDAVNPMDMVGADEEEEEEKEVSAEELERLMVNVSFVSLPPRGGSRLVSHSLTPALAARTKNGNNPTRNQMMMISLFPLPLNPIPSPTPPPTRPPSPNSSSSNSPTSLFLLQPLFPPQPDRPSLSKRSRGSGKLGLTSLLLPIPTLPEKGRRRSKVRRRGESFG